jgi:serine/threonine protein kinase
VNGGTSTTKVDMWALGIILYELSTKELPFVRDTEKQLLAAITDDQPPELPASVPPVIKTIINSLLDKNPDSRPDATTILNIPEVKEAA